MARNTLLVACAGLLVLLQFSAAQFPSALQDSSFQGASMGAGAGAGAGMGGMGGMGAGAAGGAGLSGAAGGMGGGMASRGGVGGMTPTEMGVPSGTGGGVGGMTPTQTGVPSGLSGAGSGPGGMSMPSDAGGPAMPGSSTAAGAGAGESTTTTNGAIENHDNSPVCVMNLPTCQQQCQAPKSYIYMCAAGNGPNGGPLIMCECAVPAAPVGQPQQTAKLSLTQWPGAQVCNSKTWINDCTSTLNINVRGSDVTLTPGVSSFSNEACGTFKGIVISPKGNQAAISFPDAQYPVALTSTGPDGSVTFDFSTLGAKDPNAKDWSQCVVTYKIVQGTFLNPVMGGGRAAAAAQGEETSGAGATLPMAGATLLAVLVSIMGLAWL